MILISGLKGMKIGKSLLFLGFAMAMSLAFDLVVC